MAYKYGSQGLNLLNESLRVMGENLEVPEEIRLIISPEKSDDFIVDTCTEISNLTYGKLKKGYEKLHDWSIYENQLEDPHKRLQRIMAEMLLVEQQNLRGNYPWYCIKTNGSELQNANCWQYGVRTYWMRRACLEVAKLDKRVKINSKIQDYRDKMIKSYHNVCDYLYKTGNTHLACILEMEVINQSQRLLSPLKEINSQAQIRINQNKEKKNNKDFLVHLWQMEMGMNRQ